MSTPSVRRAGAFTLLAALTAGVGCGATPERTVAAQQPDVERARFTTDGKAMRPDSWRSWIYVGSPLTPNALNGGQAAFPEFHNVYIEPSAFEAYERTGEFAEGTQIVKELVSVISDGAHEDGSTDQVSGRGYFEGEFQGLELLVKEGTRFPNEPGGWAFFSFGHHEPPYADTAQAMPTEACNACHQANADQDFVFTQFYPVLRAARPNSMMRTSTP